MDRSTSTFSLPSPPQSPAYPPHRMNISSRQPTNQHPLEFSLVMLPRPSTALYSKPLRVIVWMGIIIKGGMTSSVLVTEVGGVKNSLVFGRGVAFVVLFSTSIIKLVQAINFS